MNGISKEMKDLAKIQILVKQFSDLMYLRLAERYRHGWRGYDWKKYHGRIKGCVKKHSCEFIEDSKCYDDHVDFANVIMFDWNLKRRKK